MKNITVDTHVVTRPSITGRESPLRVKAAEVMFTCHRSNLYNHPVKTEVMCYQNDPLAIVECCNRNYR